MSSENPQIIQRGSKAGSLRQTFDSEVVCRQSYAAGLPGKITIRCRANPFYGSIILRVVGKDILPMTQSSSHFNCI